MKWRHEVRRLRTVFVQRRSQRARHINNDAGRDQGFDKIQTRTDDLHESSTYVWFVKFNPLLEPKNPDLLVLAIHSYPSTTFFTTNRAAFRLKKNRSTSERRRIAAMSPVPFDTIFSHQRLWCWIACQVHESVLTEIFLRFLLSRSKHDLTTSQR